MALTRAKSTNLAVRFLLELFALGSLGYWSFVSGGNTVAKIALGLGAPLLAAVVWGLFVAPKAAIPVAMPLRLIPEALVFGAAALALYASGHPTLAVIFVAIAVVNRILGLIWE